MNARTFTTPRQTAEYLESGPAEGPLMIFLHGWPGIGLLWRAQLDAFAVDGWHCVAPDLRGYGGSHAPGRRDAYAIREVVADVAELHDHLGGAAAIWVGHDWGSAVVGALAAHEPQRSRGVVLTSWAYFPDANSLGTLVALVDRAIYPKDRYPDGQWNYIRNYATHFESAVGDLDSDPAASLATIYRAGTPAAGGARYAPPPGIADRDGHGRRRAVRRRPPRPGDRARPGAVAARRLRCPRSALRSPGLRPLVCVVRQRRRQHHLRARGAGRRPAVAAGAVRQRQMGRCLHHHRQPTGRPNACSLRGSDHC